MAAALLALFGLTLLPVIELLLPPVEQPLPSVSVTPPRSAPDVVLWIDHRIDEIIATAPGLAPAAITVLGTQPDPWPTEIRIGDLPPEDIDLTLRTTHQSRPPDTPAPTPSP